MLRCHHQVAGGRARGARRPALLAGCVAVGLWLGLAAGLRAADWPPGLVLRFSFDDAGANGVIVDRSGHNLVGRRAGTKWTPAGKQGGGCEFAATNCYLAVSNAPALNPKQFALALWIKTAKADARRRCLLDKVAATGYALSLGGDEPEERSRGKLCFTVHGQSCWGEHRVTDGVWYHAAASFDGERLKLYVDGQLQPQVVVWHGAPEDNDHDLTIGLERSNPAPPGPSFEGVLDEVQLFSRALSEAEIQAVFAATKSRFTKGQVASQLQELKGLYDRGLLRKDFYDRKVKECEAQ